MNLVLIISQKYVNVDIVKLQQYVDFCTNANQHMHVKYKTEKHHILPRHQFPEYKETQENITHLLLKDHIKAHYLLYHANPIKSNAFALVRVLGNISNNILPKTEEELKELTIIAEENKKAFHQFMKSDKNPNRGRMHSDETKRKMSEAQKNIDRTSRDSRIWVHKLSEAKFIIKDEWNEYRDQGWYRGRPKEFKQQCIKRQLGKTHSDETKRKMSEAHLLIGENHHMKTPEMREMRRQAFLKDNPNVKAQ